MIQVKMSDKRKKRVLLIAVPLFLISFIGLFWLATSISRSFTEKSNSSDTTALAFNTKLPDPNLPDKKGKSKLDIYMENQKDSLLRQQEAARDPYLQQFYNPAPDTHPEDNPVISNKSTPPLYGRQAALAANEKKVNDKLESLYAALHEAQNAPIPEQKATTPPPPDHSEALAAMIAASQKSAPGDAELDQVNTLVEKMLDIQYPERVTNRMTADKKKQLSLVVHTSPGEADSVFTYSLPGAEGVSNAFYGLQKQSDTTTTRAAKAIRAVVHQTQTLTAGSTITLRLLQPIYIAGKEIPKDQLIYGRCSIKDERLLIRLERIICNGDIYPVQLTVFDGVDGQEGLYVQGAITRDAAKENADRAIQSIGLSSLDPSLTAQAASAGIETAKTLLSRKVRNIQVVAKAGDALLLKNMDSN